MVAEWSLVAPFCHIWFKPAKSDSKVLCADGPTDADGRDAENVWLHKPCSHRKLSKKLLRWLTCLYVATSCTGCLVLHLLPRWCLPPLAMGRWGDQCIRTTDTAKQSPFTRKAVGQLETTLFLQSAVHSWFAAGQKIGKVLRAGLGLCCKQVSEIRT